MRHSVPFATYADAESSDRPLSDASLDAVPKNKLIAALVLARRQFQEVRVRVCGRWSSRAFSDAWQDH